MKFEDIRIGLSVLGKVCWGKVIFGVKADSGKWKVELSLELGFGGGL